MQAIHDAKSEEIGPGIYRFKAEIGESAATEHDTHNPQQSKLPLASLLDILKHDSCCHAEFNGDTVVQRHMDRLGGVERLHEQIYSAVVTKRRESLDMALNSYGAQQIPSAVDSNTCIKQWRQNMLLPPLQGTT